MMVKYIDSKRIRINKRIVSTMIHAIRKVKISTSEVVILNTAGVIETYPGPFSELEVKLLEVAFSGQYHDIITNLNNGEVLKEPDSILGKALILASTHCLEYVNRNLLIQPDSQPDIKPKRTKTPLIGDLTLD